MTNYELNPSETGLTVAGLRAAVAEKPLDERGFDDPVIVQVCRLNTILEGTWDALMRIREEYEQ